MISFSGKQFPKEIILTEVRWYVAYPLSYRHIDTLKRALLVDHSTLNRWVIEYAPKLETEFRRSHKQPINTSWRMDEIYLSDSCTGQGDLKNLFFFSTG